MRGVVVDPRAGRVSLTEYARTWLESRTDIRPTTRAKYQHLLDRHILPTLGIQSVGALSPSSVRSWYMTLRSHYEVTANDAYRLLRAILNTCVDDEILTRNPCQIKGAGQVRSLERQVAEFSEVQAAVDAFPKRYRLALLLASWCALRRGEVLGLQRADVNVARAELHIRRAWTAPMGQAPVLGPPKIEKGLRLVTIPSNVMPAVQTHLERFVGSESDAWLFATQNGTALSPRNLDRVWSKAREAANCTHLRLHDLRHTGLTWAADSGARTANLMQRGGHSDPSGSSSVSTRHLRAGPLNRGCPGLPSCCTRAVPCPARWTRDGGIHNTRRRIRKPL